MGILIKTPKAEIELVVLCCHVKAGRGYQRPISKSSLAYFCSAGSS